MADGKAVRAGCHGTAVGQVRGNERERPCFCFNGNGGERRGGQPARLCGAVERLCERQLFRGTGRL
uniref:hypothetical protein n=1 Tax=Sporofaciens musculi TaxID=2681861 RepID=UPI001FCC1BD4|nr:hypothetical protein [Sporofaciens musculi]